MQACDQDGDLLLCVLEPAVYCSVQFKVTLQRVLTHVRCGAVSRTVTIGKPSSGPDSTVTTVSIHCTIVVTFRVTLIRYQRSS